MNVSHLKEYIYDNDKIEDILQDIGCGHIKNHSNEYYTCSNYDGDNKSAITVYNNENLGCVNYTRNMVDTSRATDLIDLVCYNKNLNFIQALKYLTELLGLDYYHDFEEELPESVLVTQMIFDMSSEKDSEDEVNIKPINNKILTYYKDYVNDLFEKDNIDYETQKEFGIGYDESTNRITIPIYSEIGDLCGIKARLFKEKIEDDELKYIYLEPTPRYAILYGLNKTMNYIKESGFVYVVESEKAVMQLWAYGYRNSVATGGKRVSKHQITILSRLGVKVILCFDKDVSQEEIEELGNRFVDGVPIYYIKDNDNILEKKESPSDNPEKWEHLRKNNIYKLK